MKCNLSFDDDTVWINGAGRCMVRISGFDLTEYDPDNDVIDIGIRGTVAAVAILKSASPNIVRQFEEDKR